MKSTRIKKLFLFSIFWGLSFLIFNSTFAQVGTIQVTGGGVQFIFAGLGQYSGGIQLTNWNRVKINYTNTGPRNWQLRIQSEYPSIMSSDGNPNLADLTYLKIFPVFISSSSTTYNVNAGFNLSDVGQVFISGQGTDNFEVIIGISYSFGAPPPSLTNVPWGYYYTNLRFILEYFP